MNYLIQVSICLITLYLFYFLLLRRDKFFNMQRGFLLSSIIISFFIPLVNFAPDIAQTLVPLSELSFTTDTLVIDQAIPEQTLELIDYLQVVYWAGVLLMSFRFARNLYRISRIVKNGVKEKVDGYTLIRTDEKIPLASFHKYVFLQNSLGVEDKDLTFLMLHEKKHIQDKHSIDILLISMVKVFVWFNPVLWFFEKDLKLIHEFTCDEEVIKHTSKTHYEQLLIKSLFKQVGLPFASSFNEISIKNRIIMMNKQNAIWIKKLKVLISLPVIFLLALACNPDSLPSATALEISGKVLSAEGKAMPGVNVIIDGTQTGTITNLAGEYRMANVQGAQSVTFSFVGFESETVKVGSKSVIDVMLEEGVLESSNASAKSSSTTKIDFKYEIDINDGEKFAGKLMDFSGNPLDDYSVLALGEAEGITTTKTDENGNFELSTTKITERFAVYDGEKNVQVVQIKKD